MTHPRSRHAAIVCLLFGGLLVGLMVLDAVLTSTSFFTTPPFPPVRGQTVIRILGKLVGIAFVMGVFWWLLAVHEDLFRVTGHRGLKLGKTALVLLVVPVVHIWTGAKVLWMLTERLEDIIRKNRKPIPGYLPLSFGCAVVFSVASGVFYLLVLIVLIEQWLPNVALGWFPGRPWWLGILALIVAAWTLGINLIDSALSSHAKKR